MDSSIASERNYLKAIHLYAEGLSGNMTLPGYFVPITPIWAVTNWDDHSMELSY